MKTLLFSLLWLISSPIFAQSEYEDSVARIRQREEKNFLENVLNVEERKEHPSLCYFSPDTNFRVTAIFKKEIGPIFLMPLTNNKTAEYRKYGTLTFTINDTVCVLNVYQNMSLRRDKAYKNYFFIPFKDGTSSKSTYGAGRYMDCTIWKKQQLVQLDFNFAYHPYCAYSYRYSCPIVPTENYINVSIIAGECYYEHE